MLEAKPQRRRPAWCEAIHGAAAVLIAPSNPITSIGPILAVPGIRDALRQTRAPVAAISPVVGGAAVSGPAGELMRSKGLAVSVAGVAQAYADFLNTLIVDEHDRGGQMDRPRIHLHFADTIMTTDADKLRLAQAALAIVGVRKPSKMSISRSKVRGCSCPKRFAR